MVTQILYLLWGKTLTVTNGGSRIGFTELVVSDYKVGVVVIYLHWRNNASPEQRQKVKIAVSNYHYCVEPVSLGLNHTKSQQC